MIKSNKINSGDDSINAIAGRDVNIFANAPTELIDEKIEEEADRLRKSRFFQEFDSEAQSLRLGRRVMEGDLSAGTDGAKSHALARCARALAFSDKLEAAEEFLSYAKTISDSINLKIAEAFIISLKEDKPSALQILASIDSNASRSAAFMLINHFDGSEKALNWLSDADYEVEDLDSDGKHTLLLQQLLLDYLDDAAQTVNRLSSKDFDETPVLNHIVALATLAPVIPPDYRAFAFTLPPFEAKSFPLASDTAAIGARRKAHQHFLDAVEAANQLGLARAHRISDEYALWLELRDPEQAIHGRKRLENKLSDPSLSLGLVHFAIQFDVKLDLEKVEQNIAKSIAINGRVTSDVTSARFALAFTQPNPTETAKYFDQYSEQLKSHNDPKLIRFYQVELFSRAGLVDRANSVLDQLIEEGITLAQTSNLRRVITDAEGISNPIESRKAQYAETKALNDLINLVVELGENHSWDDACEYGGLLFEETKSIEDACRFANALINAHRSANLVRFVDNNVNLLEQSYRLRMLYAWALYQEGMFLQSQAALVELKANAENEDYRQLQVNLWIATGAWASLSTHVNDEYQKKDCRSAKSLLNTAQLALQIGSSLAKELSVEAVAKANDDPAILSSAFGIASNAGWESDPDVRPWLKRAIELSSDDGVIQKISLKELLDQTPEWESRESETWNFLTKGEAPTFMVAQSLNRSLVDLTIFPAFTNLNETDPRRRAAVSAYSGKRTPLVFDVSDKIIAIDATALLTLSFLNILGAVLDAFKTVYIPHSTLGWLFQERQKAKFHQPSRIEDAHKVRNFLAKGALKEFIPSSVGNSELSKQVGSELAGLITEAEHNSESDNSQRIVVRSAPVHRVSSLMEEEADLSKHSAVMSSCLAVVQKLKEKGQLTAKEENQARDFLTLREQPWPEQPEIADGATLYLDDLAISYLLHLGLLGKLKVAGLSAIVSPREVREADSLISYESISGEVESAIEHIRVNLNSRIESEKVRFGSLDSSSGAFSGQSYSEHPCKGILSLAHQCDLMVIDDRYLNQHANVVSNDVQAPVLSTLDLLDSLVETGVLTDDDNLESRTRLRRAGYFFIPVTEDELEQCLDKADTVDGKVIETAELKAIRESILRVRMSHFLQLPEEAPWLEGSLKALVRVLRKLWIDDANFEGVTARSNWLAEQIDIRGWAHRLIPENADNIVRTGRASYVLLLLSPPIGVQQKVLDTYWNWAEETILVPVKEQYPEIYEWLVDFYRNQTAKFVENQFLEEDDK